MLEHPKLGVLRPNFHAKSLKPSFGQFRRFSPRFSSTFYPLRSIFCFFLISFSQFQSALISFNQFDSVQNAGISLINFSLQISEDFWVFLSFPSDRSIFSTFVGGYKNTAIAEKREVNKYILNSRRFFDVCVFVLNSNSLTKRIFSRMCIYIWNKINYCEKREVCVSNSKSMALRFPHVCVCVLSS